MRGLDRCVSEMHSCRAGTYFCALAAGMVNDLNSNPKI
jgi:hypothetical protein